MQRAMFWNSQLFCELLNQNLLIKSFVTSDKDLLLKLYGSNPLCFYVKIKVYSIELPTYTYNVLLYVYTVLRQSE